MELGLHNGEHSHCLKSRFPVTKKYDFTLLFKMPQTVGYFFSSKDQNGNNEITNRKEYNSVQVVLARFHLGQRPLHLGPAQGWLMLHHPASS